MFQGKFMKLSFLIVIIALIFICYFFLYKPFIEKYTAGTYVITWREPSDTGGDPDCCGYDWQMCSVSDKDCESPIDGGTVTTPTASTDKASWGETYTIRVRAVNALGPGPWASSNLSTGSGALTSITFGETISENGNVEKQLTVSSRQISVWIGTTKSAIPKLSATLFLTQMRGSSTIGTYKIPMTYGSFSNLGNFSATIPNISIQNEDVFNAYIYVVDGNKAWADSQGAIVVKENMPGTVSGITWTYRAASH